MDGTEVKRRKRTHNRTPEEVEIGILETRQWLKDESPLGEFGAVAIHRQMEEWGCSCLPSIRTIGNIIGRCGKVSRNARKQKKAPATGWYLPEVVEGIEDVDCVDFIEKLHLEGRGRWVHVLNIISAHGRLAASFPMTKMSATQVVHCLLEHWRQHGFPRYVQFDNGLVFAGPPKPDCVGQVVKLCLQVGIIPVFAPPRETGPQNVVEGYNAQWQRGVWPSFSL